MVLPSATMTACAATSAHATNIPPRPDRCRMRALSFESNLNPELTVFGVVERAECRRAHVVLNVRRQEGAQRVPHTHADPWLEFQDLEAALQPDLEPLVG